jgi:hypothetical protein
MLNAIERILEVALTDCRRIGQIGIRKLDGGGFALSHCDDEDREDLKLFCSAEDAIELSKFDDGGNYRPLKTAPNLRHRWRLDLQHSKSLGAPSIIFIQEDSLCSPLGKAVNCEPHRCATHWIDNPGCGLRRKFR